MPDNEPTDSSASVAATSDDHYTGVQALPTPDELKAASADVSELLTHSEPVRMLWVGLLVSRQMYRLVSAELTAALSSAVMPATPARPEARPVHPLAEEVMIQSVANLAMREFDPLDMMLRLEMAKTWLQGTIEKNAKQEIAAAVKSRQEADAGRRKLPIPIGVTAYPPAPGELQRDLSLILIGYGPAVRLLIDHAVNTALAAQCDAQPNRKFCVIRLTGNTHTLPVSAADNGWHVQLGRSDWQGNFSTLKRTDHLMLTTVQPRLGAQPDLLVVDDLAATVNTIAGSLSEVGEAPFSCNEAHIKLRKWCELAGAGLLAGVPTNHETGNDAGALAWENLRTHATLRPVNVVRKGMPPGKARIVVGRDAFTLDVDEALLQGDRIITP